MKYKNDEYRSRYARALKAANNLASSLSPRLQDEPALMPPALRSGLNAPGGNLVLLPWADDQRPFLGRAVQETRSSVIIVEPGSTMTGSPTFYLTLVHCRRGEVLTHRALRLWVDIEKNAYLVPDRAGDAPDGECFAIEPRGVRAVAASYAHEIDLELGLAHGDALLLAP